MSRKKKQRNKALNKCNAAKRARVEIHTPQAQGAKTDESRPLATPRDLVSPLNATGQSLANAALVFAESSRFAVGSFMLSLASEVNEFVKALRDAVEVTAAQVRFAILEARQAPLFLADKASHALIGLGSPAGLATAGVSAVILISSGAMNPIALEANTAPAMVEQNSASAPYEPEQSEAQKDAPKPVATQSQMTAPLPPTAGTPQIPAEDAMEILRRLGITTKPEQALKSRQKPANPDEDAQQDSVAGGRATENPFARLGSLPERGALTELDDGEASSPEEAASAKNDAFERVEQRRRERESQSKYDGLMSSTAFAPGMPPPDPQATPPAGTLITKTPRSGRKESGFTITREAPEIFSDKIAPGGKHGGDLPDIVITRASDVLVRFDANIRDYRSSNGSLVSVTPSKQFPTDVYLHLEQDMNADTFSMTTVFITLDNGEVFPLRVFPKAVDLSRHDPYLVTVSSKSISDKPLRSDDEGAGPNLRGLSFSDALRSFTRKSPHVSGDGFELETIAAKHLTHENTLVYTAFLKRTDGRDYNTDRMRMTLWVNGERYERSSTAGGAPVSFDMDDVLSMQESRMRGGQQISHLAIRIRASMKEVESWNSMAVSVEDSRGYSLQTLEIPVRDVIMADDGSAVTGAHSLSQEGQQ